MNIKYICSALLGMTMLSCTSEALEDAKLSNELLNVEKEVELTAVETKRTVEVSADCRWTIAVDKSQWSSLTVQPLEGNGNSTITLTTDENNSINERTAQLTITSAAGLRQKITVRQTLGGAKLEVSEPSLSFEAEPKNPLTFTVTSNTSWSIPNTGNDWLTVQPSSGDEGVTVVTVTAEEIQDDKERNATLTVIPGVGTESCRIQVTQAGKTTISLNLNPEELSTFEAMGGEQSITITSNVRWYVDTTGKDWLTPSAEEGVGNGTLTFSCQPNYTTEENTARINITAGSRNPIEKTIRVTQKAGKLPEITSPLAIVDNTTSSSGATFTFGYESMFPLTDYGICYSTTNDTPTVDDTCIPLGEGSTSNSAVSVTLDNLTPFTDYNVRAYVKSPMNNGAVIYSNTVTLHTLGTAPSGDDNPYPELGRSKK